MSDRYAQVIYWKKAWWVFAYPREGAPAEPGVKFYRMQSAITRADLMLRSNKTIGRYDVFDEGGNWVRSEYLFQANETQSVGG